MSMAVFQEAAMAMVAEVNIFGKYPVCKPVTGDISSTCERCGGYAGYDLPCPAIPPEKRWGEDSGIWLIAEIASCNGDTVELRGEPRINGVTFNSPILRVATAGEVWAIYWTKGAGMFGRVEFALRLSTPFGVSETGQRGGREA